MAYVDYKVLESLLIEGERQCKEMEMSIANEGLKTDEGEVVSTSKMREFFNKYNLKIGETFSYWKVPRFLTNISIKNPELLKNFDNKSELLKFYNLFYNRQLSADIYNIRNSKDEQFIHKYEPMPIYNDGYGNFYCLTNRGNIVLAKHDKSQTFSDTYKNFDSFKQFREEILN